MLLCDSFMRFFHYLRHKILLYIVYASSFFAGSYHTLLLMQVKRRTSKKNEFLKKEMKNYSILANNSFYVSWFQKSQTEVFIFREIYLILLLCTTYFFLGESTPIFRSNMNLNINFYILNEKNEKNEKESNTRIGIQSGNIKKSSFSFKSTTIVFLFLFYVIGTATFN